jgi:O-antigen/teichoic acid export membrane protein
MNSPDWVGSKLYGFDQIRRGLIQIVLGRGITVVFGIAASLILVRFMPVKDYAVFATLAGLQIFLVVIASLGLDRIITRFVPEARLNNDTHSLARLIWELLVWRIGGLLVVIIPMMVMTPHILVLLNAEGYELAFEGIWLCTLLFGLSQHVMRSLHSIMEQVAVKWAQLCEFLPRVLIISGWVLMNGSSIGVTEAVWIIAACTGLGLLVQITFLRCVLGNLGQGKIGKQAPYSEIFRMGRNNYMQTMLSLPSEPPSLRLVGACFLDAPAMAAYGFFQTVTSAVRRNLPVQLLLDIFEPAIIARYAQTGNFRELNSMTNSMLKINAYFIFPAIGWLLVAGGSMVSILTGGKYVDSAWVLIILMGALLYESHWIVLRTAANAVGQFDVLVKGGLCALIGMAGMVVILAWQLEYSLIILTLGILGILFLQNLMAVWQMRHAGYIYVLDGSGMTRLALAAAIASGFAWITRLALSPEPLLLVLLTSVVMALTYILIVRKIRIFEESERDMIGRMCKVFKKFV